MKNKNEKKKVADFDKLDISIATEEEIISSGIKKNTSSDKRNYLLMTIVFILMFLPPLLRLFFPKPILFVEKDVVYTTLNCFISNNRHEQTWRFDSNYKLNFRDGIVEEVLIEYSYNKNLDTAKDDVTFPEITVLNDITLDSSKGFKKENLGSKKRDDMVEVHKRAYTLDFKNHRKDLETIGELKKYSYNFAPMQDYFKSSGFLCRSDAKTVKEMVSVK